MVFVDYEKKGKITIITLDRPELLNAIGGEMTDGLCEACEKFESDTETRVAIFTGAGRAFSSGADVKEMAVEPIRIGAAYAALEKVTKPCIAAINGLVAGGALRFLSRCDIRIAAESATFSFPEIELALAPGPEVFLNQGLSLCVAMELILTGERISAERACSIGLINKVVPDAELMPAAMKVAERIAQLSHSAVSLVRQSAVRAMQEHVKTYGSSERTGKSREEILAAEDHKEAVRAYIEKRKPVFRDR